MEVCEVTFGVGAGVRGVVYVWPYSVAAYMRVRCGEYDVREYFPVQHFTCASVNFIVVGNSNVGFDFSDVACEAFVISCFNDDVRVAEEIFVCAVCVSEGVEGIVAKCVNAEGTIRKVFGGVVPLCACLWLG